MCLLEVSWSFSEYFNKKEVGLGELLYSGLHNKCRSSLFVPDFAKFKFSVTCSVGLELTVTPKKAEFATV